MGCQWASGKQSQWQSEREWQFHECDVNIYPRGQLCACCEPCILRAPLFAFRCRDERAGREARMRCERERQQRTAEESGAESDAEPGGLWSWQPQPVQPPDSAATQPAHRVPQSTGALSQLASRVVRQYA